MRASLSLTVPFDDSCLELNEESSASKPRKLLEKIPISVICYYAALVFVCIMENYRISMAVNCSAIVP